MTTLSPLDAPPVAKGSPLDVPTQLELFEQDLDVLPHNKALYRVDEAAEMLNCSSNHIKDLGDAGELEMIPINDRIDPPPVRLHHRITGRSILAFLNRRRRMAL